MDLKGWGAWGRGHGVGAQGGGHGVGTWSGGTGWGHGVGGHRVGAWGGRHGVGGIPLGYSGNSSSLPSLCPTAWGLSIDQY